METQQQVVVQEEIAAAPVPMAPEPLAISTEEPFRISLKAERVQEPSALLAGAGGPVSFAYELSFNQMRALTVHLEEPRIVITFATGGLAAA